MDKAALATQVPKSLKARLDAECGKRGITLSHLITQAIQEKLDALHEEEALLKMAMERLAEPGERTYKDYRRALRLMR
ncbi:MAG: hypothetical protein HYV03_01520 [Deltaproteobacteria bacterium]|nr:hypothetical protein [Deltaproteobacteria bacterium]